MANIKNFKQSILEIGQLLAQSDRLRSLLYNDQTTALTDPVPELSLSELLNEGYITIYPPIETSVDNIKRNTFLIILLDQVNLRTTDDNIRGNIVIYVTTDKDHILLENNKSRTLEMVDEVLQTLDDKKLTSAGQIVVNNISHVMLSNFRAGYRINLSITDQERVKVSI